jgi:hypothetical protein
MNRFINALLLFIFFPTLALAIFVGFDLPIESLHTTGALLTHKSAIFLCLGLLLLTVVLRRTIRRWMGMSIVLRKAKFIWNEESALERLKRVRVYTGMEAIVFLASGLGLYSITSYAWLPALALIVVFADNLLFILVGRLKNGFRIGITSKAVIMADREVQIIYFSGLRKISIHQDSLFFDYINELQLNFPIDSIDPKNRDAFFEQLHEQIDRERVFVTTKRS